MVYLYAAMVYATSQPDIVLFLPCRECPPSNAAMRRQICQRRGLQHWILRLIVCQKHQWQDIWDVEFCVTDLEFLDPLNMWLQYLLCLLFVTHFVWDWRMLDASRFTAFGVPSCKYRIWIHTLWFSCASTIFFFNDKKRDLTNPQEFDNHDTIRTSTSCSFSPCFHCTFDQVFLIWMGFHTF